MFSVLVRADAGRARLAGVLTVTPAGFPSGGCYGAFEPSGRFPVALRRAGILGADADEVRAVLTGELAAAFLVAEPDGGTVFLTGAKFAAVRG